MCIRRLEESALLLIESFKLVLLPRVSLLPLSVYFCLRLFTAIYLFDGKPLWTSEIARWWFEVLEFDIAPMPT